MFSKIPNQMLAPTPCPNDGYANDSIAHNPHSPIHGRLLFLTIMEQAWANRHLSNPTLGWLAFFWVGWHFL
jgi:hypothetical protein